MFLKSLTLKGFKSFAEPTTLVFEPGVTVVVGPNGSGKSNVVDAIAWVLGAQGAKALRGGRMEDVIFAGTARRQELGRAEVTLTIDNGSGRLPVAAAEVSITRTLFRDGDSQYALNGAPCRLLDVQELLSDAGVGRTQHVIVGQGQLDAVLEAKPEDRRSAIEEAAGILKYRKRRERAQRRLDSTEADLERLGDIEAEVRRQLRPLERQAEAARRHAAAAAELRRLRRQVAVAELASLDTAVSKAHEALAAATARHRTALAALEQAERDVSAAEDRLSGAAVPPDSEDIMRRAQQVAARAAAAVTTVDERSRSLSREAALAVDTESETVLAAERASLESELEQAELDAGALGPDMAQLAGRRAELEQRRRAVQLRERHSAESLQAIMPRPDGDALVAARSEMAGLVAGLERDEAALARLSARGSELTAAAACAFGRRQTLATDVATAESACRVAIEAENRLRASAEDARRIRSDAEERLRRAQSDVQAAEVRIEALSMALTELRDRSGASCLDDAQGVLGNLAEVVSVADGWEKALASALGEAFGGVVVDGYQRALDAATKLATDGRFAVVLPLPPPGSAGPGVVGPAAGAAGLRQLVQGHTPEIELLMDVLVGHVVAFDGSLPEAVEHHLATGQVVVNRDGDLISADGWRVGAKAPGVTASALEQARSAAAGADAALRRAEAEFHQAGAASDAAERSAAEAASEAREAERRRSAAVDQLALVSQELDRTEAGLADLAEQIGVTSERIDGDKRRSVELEQRLATLQRAEQEATAAWQAAAHDASRLSEQVASEREELAASTEALAALEADLQARAAGLEERRRMLRARHARVVAEQERNKEAGQRILRRRAEISASLVACASLGTLARSLHGGAEELVGRLSAVHLRHRRQLDAASGAVSEVRHARAGAAERLSDASEVLLGCRAALSEAEARLAAASESWHQKLGCYQPCDGGPRCRLHDAGPEPVGPAAGGGTDSNAPGPPESGLGDAGPQDAGEGNAAHDVAGWPGHEEAVARVSQLENELRKMGPVNPLALDQARELRERSEFVSSQLEDVKAARRELSKVIRAVDHEIVATFESAWTDVAANFEALLQAVFPGGSGALRLVGAEDMLSAGVEIEARPAGKAVKKLSLLSGGERSLVALAFLFSLFRSRPSPFYVMDEVEAALDDVNLNRFLSLVGELRQHAQLLLVSHQKRTMETADCLYGVTMQPGGSSKVVGERVTAAAAAR